MDKYAIIEIKNRQYLVQEGTKFESQKLSLDTPVDVLLLKDKETTLIGEPFVAKGGVTLTLLGPKRVKTSVRRYKSKSRYRKDKSHTDSYSVLEVSSISLTSPSSKIVALKEKTLVKTVSKTEKNTTKAKTKTVKKVKTTK
jgi:ribosomal protein L21